MMNIGRWDDARESLDKARKAAPKADHIHYALAALDLPHRRSRFRSGQFEGRHPTAPGEPLSRAQRRGFRFPQEDPRFTELLYPEKDGLAS